jgi:hypothetical protein
MKMTRFFFIVFLSAYLFSCKKDNSKALPETLLYAKRGENAGIYDQQGRFVILRGVNYNALGDYWQANPAVPTNKQYDEEDLKLMAKLWRQLYSFVVQLEQTGTSTRPI